MWRSIQVFLAEIAEDFRYFWEFVRDTSEVGDARRAARLQREEVERTFSRDLRKEEEN